MSLTKEECVKAVTSAIEKTTEIDEYESIPQTTYCIIGDELNTFKQLINEHFDNPPLKFEELKKGMWVWDNNWKQYFEICEIYPETKEFDVLIHQNRINKQRYEPIEFEENRFYRREVNNDE